MLTLDKCCNCNSELSNFKHLIPVNKYNNPSFATRRIVVLIHCYMRNRMQSPIIKIFNLSFIVVTSIFRYIEENFLLQKNLRFH
jgi:hypothetical protein